MLFSPGCNYSVEIHEGVSVGYDRRPLRSVVASAAASKLSNQTSPQSGIGQPPTFWTVNAVLLNVATKAWNLTHQVRVFASPVSQRLFPRHTF